MTLVLIPRCHTHLVPSGIMQGSSITCSMIDCRGSLGRLGTKSPTAVSSPGSQAPTSSGRLLSGEAGRWLRARFLVWHSLASKRYPYDCPTLPFRLQGWHFSCTRQPILSRGRGLTTNGILTNSRTSTRGWGDRRCFPAYSKRQVALNQLVNNEIQCTRIGVGRLVKMYVGETSLEFIWATTEFILFTS